jgi:gamma-glutamylcyclotransferase (GGCT)/AIG2-like uncharacterized protein YtfP
VRGEPELAVADDLFVYGTLRPGFTPGQLGDLLAAARRLGRATVAGRLYHLGPYPGAVLDPRATTRVVGEVLRLPEDGLLAALDAYEVCDPGDPARSVFFRVRQEVELASGRRLPCWVYVYNRDLENAVLIPDGDYARWCQGRRDVLAPQGEIEA